MTTYYNFTPTQQGPFQFQPQMDGDIYNVIVTWSLFGQRYYVNVYDLSGNLIVSLPLVSSPPLFTIQNASWSEGQAILAFSEAHGYPVGTTLRMTVAGMTPDAYNGTFIVLATTENAVSYDVATNPGQPTVLGTAGTDVNLMAGYFASSMVFREDTQRFEISP